LKKELKTFHQGLARKKKASTFALPLRQKAREGEEEEIERIKQASGNSEEPGIVIEGLVRKKV
jgi:glutamyl-tRNA reductase